MTSGADEDRFRRMYEDELAESTRLRAICAQLSTENAELRRSQVSDYAYLIALTAARGRGE